MSIEKGDVIQLNPAEVVSQWARGLLMIVEEVKPWGVVCYALVPADPQSIVPYRAATGSFERIGKAIWTQETL